MRHSRPADGWLVRVVKTSRVRAGLRLGAATMLAFASSSLVAADLTLEISDQKGRPVDDAVATLRGQNLASESTANAVMDQVEETFVPTVLPLRPGTPVRFPNHDDMRHHVYSFSDAKKFELPLYKGTPAEPVVFDRAGVVVLGCNIHDWMRGYIYVTDASRFVVVAAGKAAFVDLPAGRYQIEIWHPELRGEPWKGEVELTEQGFTQQVSLVLKPSLRIRRAPKAGAKPY